MRTLQKTAKTRKGGYAVLELLFYLALFAVLGAVVIDALVTMTHSFKETTIEAELVQSGSVMERMVREIRGAYAISAISANNLILNTKDNNGVNKTVEFLLNGSNLELKENSVLTGNLNSPKISVTNLAFSQVTTAKGKAIKILLILQANNDASGRTENFYDTIVLRGDY